MNLYNIWFHILKWVTKNIDLFPDIQFFFDVRVFTHITCKHLIQHLVCETLTYWHAYVTLEHKSSHKGPFFYIEIYA